MAGGQGTARRCLFAHGLIVAVHSLRQARDVAALAAQRDLDVLLTNPPGALAYTGVDYFAGIAKRVPLPLMLDCGDDAGLVMQAVYARATLITCTLEPPLRTRLNAMVEQSGGELVAPDGLPQRRITLLPNDHARYALARALGLPAHGEPA